MEFFLLQNPHVMSTGERFRHGTVSLYYCGGRVRIKFLWAVVIYLISVGDTQSVRPIRVPFQRQGLDVFKWPSVGGRRSFPVDGRNGFPSAERPVGGRSGRVSHMNRLGD